MTSNLKLYKISTMWSDLEEEIFFYVNDLNVVVIQKYKKEIINFIGRDWDDVKKYFNEIWYSYSTKWDDYIYPMIKLIKD